MLKWFGPVVASCLSPATLVVWVVLTIVLTVSGPFGTYERMDAATRLFDFAITSGIVLIIGVSTRALLQQGMLSLRFIPAVVIASILTSVILAVPVRQLFWRIAGVRAPVDIPAWHVAGIIAFSGFGSAAIRWAIARETTYPARDHAPPAEPADAGPRTPRLLDRLPEDIRGPLVRVSGQNHYVEVTTDNGSARVLLRLSDALAEIDSTAGAQVHRSHWVAASAVARRERDGARQVLVLRDGSRVPIGKSYLDNAEQLTASGPAS